MTTTKEFLPEVKEAIALLKRAIPGIVDDLPRYEAAAEVGWLNGIRPVRAMIAAGLQITDLELAIWSSRGFEYLAQLPGLVSPDLVERVPPHEALDMGAFVVGRNDNTVVIAVLDPTNSSLLTELRARFSEYDVGFVVTNRPALQAAVERHEDTEPGDELADKESLARASQLQEVEQRLASCC